MSRTFFKGVAHRANFKKRGAHARSHCARKHRNQKNVLMSALRQLQTHEAEEKSQFLLQFLLLCCVTNSQCRHLRGMCGSLIAGFSFCFGVKQKLRFFFCFASLQLPQSRFFKAANARSKSEKTGVVIISAQAYSAYIFSITTPAAMPAHKKRPYLRAFSWNRAGLLAPLNKTRPVKAKTRIILSKN